jgi:hypothetical protein
MIVIPTELRLPRREGEPQWRDLLFFYMGYTNPKLFRLRYAPLPFATAQAAAV